LTCHEWRWLNVVFGSMVLTSLEIHWKCRIWGLTGAKSEPGF
jgi:hypothetical protein